MDLRARIDIFVEGTQPHGTKPSSTEFPVMGGEVDYHIENDNLGSKTYHWTVQDGFEGGNLREGQRKVYTTWSERARRCCLAFAGEFTNSVNVDEYIGYKFSGQGDFDWASGRPSSPIDSSTLPVASNTTGAPTIQVRRLSVSTTRWYNSEIDLASSTNGRWIFWEGREEGARTNREFYESR